MMTKPPEVPPVPNRRFWPDWQIALLRQAYPTYRSEAIAAVIGRPVLQVHAQARKLGLRKDPACIAQWARDALEDPNHGYRRAQFRPGHTPANKGRKQPGYAPGRMASTQFKPGKKPYTWVPVGSHRVNGAGNLERKLNDLPGPSAVRWTPVHRLVWIEAHGPIPDGMVLVFKPGRHSTKLEEITEDALELITRQQLMARNTVHARYPPELVRVAQLRGLLTRAINRRSKDTRDNQPAKEAETP